MDFSAEEKKWYARQMLIEGWGEKGQKKLQRSKVFIAGAGGLGSPVALYLAAAGVGTLRIADFDVVDWSNLNRQILHDPARVGRLKTASAETTLNRVNPNIHIEPVNAKIDADNVDQLVGDADIIVDCMDNFPTRYVLNACAIRKRIPLVFGSIWGMDGRVSLIRSPETPCLQCIFPEAPPKEVFPVIGATPGVVGSLQAMETLKTLTGIGRTLEGRLLVLDGAEMDVRVFSVGRDPLCPACSQVVSAR